MKKETLRTLSDDDFKKLIALLELDIEWDFQSELSEDVRLSLEDDVYEELEEIRRERLENSTFPVQYQDQRYSCIEDIFGLNRDIDFGSFEFPEQYNVTRLVLMLRDPEWAFVYWDISYADKNRLAEHGKPGSMRLVLQEIDENQEGGDANLVRVEIPVQTTDNRWYINIPRRGTTYYAALCAGNPENPEVLCRSGLIHVPTGALSPEFAAATVETELLMALSEIQSLGVSSYEEIPNRILKHVEEE